MNTHIIRFFAYIKQISRLLHEKTAAKKHLAPLFQFFFHPRLWRFHPREAAGAVALGVFLGFTPLMGTHMVLGIIAAYLFKVNLPLLLLCVWISNPLTYPFLILYYYYLGSFLLGMDVQYQIGGDMVSVFLGLSKPVWMGSLISASVFGLFSYYITFIFVTVERRLRHQFIIKKRAKRKELRHVSAPPIPRKQTAHN